MKVNKKRRNCGLSRCGNRHDDKYGRLITVTTQYIHTFDKRLQMFYRLHLHKTGYIDRDAENIHISSTKRIVNVL